MIMKTLRTIKVASNVSKHIIILLCALLFTGFMGEDFSTSDGDRNPDHHMKVEEKFNQRPVHRPCQDGHVYRRKQHPVFPFPSQISGHGIRSNTDDGQYILHHSWSDVDTKSRWSTSTTQAIRGMPHGMSLDIFEKGCSTCCDEDAYKTREAIWYSHCAAFVCRTCYENMHEVRKTPITSDYHIPLSTGSDGLKVRCPFCRGSF
jgi:hypothetical protein